MVRSAEPGVGLHAFELREEPNDEEVVCGVRRAASDGVHEPSRVSR
ncbi:hypothetical protein [Saccharopolyspora pogona]|nr:hypothetical protein [Saccharopolyspora pogona]